MGEEVQAITGACSCGAVRYQATGEPVRVIACHCRSCRRQTGAPAVVLAVYQRDRVTFGGAQRKIYSSSPGVGRAFCADCGTPLTWETDFGDLGPVCALHISAFDDPDALVPTAHSFYSERLAWFDIADDLPRYRGFVKDGTLLCHGPARADPSA